jgi:Flp pilus assembly protein TadG
MRTTRKWSRERGTQIAEFAIALPLFLFVALMIIDGGSLVYTHQVLNNAAREGARLASQRENKDSAPAIQDAVKDYFENTARYDPSSAKNGKMTAWNVSVNQSIPVALPTGMSMKMSRVTVTCSYKVQFLSKLPFFGVPSSFPLKATAQFRNLYD